MDIYVCVLQCATYVVNQVQQCVDIICAAEQSLVRGGGYQQGGHEGCGGRLRPMALCTLSLCTYSLCICVFCVKRLMCWGVGEWRGHMKGGTAWLHTLLTPLSTLDLPDFRKSLGGESCDTFY